MSQARNVLRSTRRGAALSSRETLRRLAPRSLGHAAVVSWLRWVASVAVMLLVFPIMIARMGTQGFGLWAALTAPTNMTALFGLGVAPAVVSVLGRSLGSARASTGDPEAAEHLHHAGSCARAGLALSLAAAGISILVGFSIARPIVDLLKVPPAQVESALWLFRASCLCLGGMLLGGGMVALLEAYGRVDMSAAANGLVTVSNAVFLLVAVLVQPSFHSLAWVSAATAVSNVAAPFACLMGTGGSVLLRWGRLDLAAFRRLGGLALSLGFVGGIGAIVDPAVKWTVGALGGGAAVAAYELASRALSVLAGSFNSLLAPLMPYYARSLTEHGSAHVAQRVISSSRLLATVAFPTIAVFAAASNGLMQLWLGGNMPSGSVESLEILAIATIVSIGLRAAWGALIAAGQGARLLFVQLVSVGCVPVVLALAAGHWLPLGVAAATAYGSYALVGGGLTLVQYGRFFGKDVAYRLLRSAKHGVMLAGLVIAPVLAARFTGVSAAQETAVAGTAWVIVLIYLVRSEPQVRSIAKRAWHRFHKPT